MLAMRLATRSGSLYQPPPPPPPELPPPPPPPEPLELGAETPEASPAAATLQEAMAPAPPNWPPPPDQPELPLDPKLPPLDETLENDAPRRLSPPKARNQRSTSLPRPKARRYGSQSSCRRGFSLFSSRRRRRRPVPRRRRLRIVPSLSRERALLSRLLQTATGSRASASAPGRAGMVVLFHSSHSRLKTKNAHQRQTRRPGTRNQSEPRSSRSVRLRQATAARPAGSQSQISPNAM